MTSFEAPDDILEREGLSTLAFDGVTEEWARFIINNRDKTFPDPSSPECNADAKHDVVFGPVGDDDITYLLCQYTRSFIDDVQLRRGLEFKRASDQYSFHTERAVALLVRTGVRHVR